MKLLDGAEATTSSVTVVLVIPVKGAKKNDSYQAWLA